MRIEEIYFYKLILLCGYPEELNQAISTALDHQNPIESDILDLSACRGDVKKQLSVLNAILAREGEELLDHQAVFELVRQFLYQQYTAGMDISTLVKLMYRIANETGWYDEEAWNTLFLMEDCYDDAQWGINGMEDFLHQLECLLMPTALELDCAIPISAIKQQLTLYEQQGIRLPVYRYLKELWNTSFRTEDLTVLIIQQMMFYLIELESPWVKWEAEDEHQTYQIFLHEALAYGFVEFIHEKKFMWNLCFFLEASGVYHCIFGDQIPIGSEKTLQQKLYAEAKKRYPTSVLFDIIPLVQGGDPLWRDKISDDVKKALIAEVSEWNLMTNMVDQDMQELLSITDCEGKLMLSKRFVLAQVLYHMALHDKTQKQIVVWGKKKQALIERLNMYHQIIGWLTSDEALQSKQCKELLEYIQNQSHSFPYVSNDILSEICALDYRIECDRALCGDEMKAIGKMVDLLQSLEPVLSRRTPCSNMTWIKTFMAFHNLPRVFFGSDLRGLWDEAISHLNLNSALESSSFFE